MDICSIWEIKLFFSTGKSDESGTPTRIESIICKLALYYPQYTIEQLFNDIPIIQIFVMLNEAVHKEQSFLFNLLNYMSVATAQVDKTNKHKIKSAAKKLKPKYMYKYDFVTKEEVKENLNDIENFRKNFKDKP